MVPRYVNMNALCLLDFWHYRKTTTTKFEIHIGHDRKPKGNPRKSGKVSVGGCGGRGGSIFIVIFKQKCGPKLRRFIRPHFGTSRFSISRWEKPKSHHVHDFLKLGSVRDSKNLFFLTLETPRYFLKYKKRDLISNILYLEISKSWKSTIIGNVVKDPDRQIVKIHLINSNLECGIDTFKNTGIHSFLISVERNQTFEFYFSIKGA